MSRQGLEMAAKVLSVMQESRGELLRQAAKVGASSPEGKQDILLAQMMETGKEAIKEDFCLISTGKYPCHKCKDGCRTGA